MNVLVTGGTGYIGSHTVLELIKNNHDVIIVDNFSNSSPAVLDRMEKLADRKVDFYNADIRDENKLRDIFREHSIDLCVHFAALKSVGESVQKPIEYYENNLCGTLTLLKLMREFDCKKLVYSSSATVYGESPIQPITEDCPRAACTNPYGWTKSITEQILLDLSHADPEWRIATLRYFNPLGAHKSGMLGDSPNGIPANLMPFITQVAIGKRNKLFVFGNTYNTKDGTCIRDYIHVLDLAAAHVAVIPKLTEKPGIYTYNLGTGQGYSVLEVIDAFEKANHVKIPYEITAAREGDSPVAYSDPAKALRELSWKAEYTLHDMCVDSWNWQQKNPNGYSQ